MKTTTYSKEEKDEQQKQGSLSEKLRSKWRILSSSIAITAVSSRIVVIMIMIIIVAAVSSSSSSSRIIHYWKKKLSIPILISNNTHNTHQPCISAFQVMMNTNTSISTSNDNDDEVIIDSMDRALSMIQTNYPE
jgi:hypothetical protein